MSLHSDLLRQAKQLARLEPRHPRPASLRRAVSAAYYALFHLLIHEATRTLISAPDLRNRFARAFDHGDMKAASNAFANPPADLKRLTGGTPIPPDLQTVAETFAMMQEERHHADYDLGKNFTRVEVNNLVATVDQAFRLWPALRTDPATRSYLAALLLWKKWNR
jgi:hypothetical protein